MDQTIKLIKPIMIKVEIEDDEDYPCQLCSKSFANTKALMNHVRMEHITAAEDGVDPSSWLAKPSTTITNTKKDVEEMDSEEQTAEFMSSLQPVNLMSLASEDVSYIIIKANDQELEKVEMARKRKIKEVSEMKVSPKRHYTRPNKEPIPITGPFECLQPSSLVEERTCHQIFFSCCEYSTHFRDEHTKRKKGSLCQVCEKPLPSSGEEQTWPYMCQLCHNIGYNTNKELQDHLNKLHIKVRPYKCEVCHKRFTQQGGLQQHMRMHTGDRPFPCTHCDKAFTQRSGLDQHLRTHTKVKPYRCVVCNKTFCQSVHLKQHMRTHTNVAPFQCGICDKRFKQSSHLNYHLKSHTESNMTAEQKAKYLKLMETMIVGEAESEVEQSVQVLIEQQDEEYILTDSVTWMNRDEEEVEETEE